MKLYSQNPKGAALKSRDQRLADTDWTQANDSPLSEEKKAEWATYRQALRDLPAQEGFPNVAFPTPPQEPEPDWSHVNDPYLQSGE